eukprot:CAMPEP_0181210392 /NCGR_PEP_ID=MMETSP1096-20121128/23203_1 /TAXON_ID=156174 ORGANISM="Chrysochromulina ericina, Strain CCMP281" /NCGR_SAMPLE_ID=MMETSP1096 /ASSEMBLY_ACC=CAM_ASM_000453 /LENGTH=85 /DNA_ID=CAMNT_0023301673 /DNA_START=256 /DNA_END=513 /DNA_ORIENTATION=-
MRMEPAQGCTTLTKGAPQCVELIAAIDEMGFEVHPHLTLTLTLILSPSPLPSLNLTLALVRILRGRGRNAPGRRQGPAADTQLWL